MKHWQPVVKVSRHSRAISFSGLLMLIKKFIYFSVSEGDDCIAWIVRILCKYLINPRDRVSRAVNSVFLSAVFSAVLVFVWWAEIEKRFNLTFIFAVFKNELIIFAEFKNELIFFTTFLNNRSNFYFSAPCLSSRSTRILCY